MSVKIEILDYKYGNGVNIVDATGATAATGWSAISVNQAQWAGISGGSSFTYFENLSQDLLVGRTYNLSFNITDYVGIGNIGFSTQSGVPVSARFSSDTNGIQTFTFVATATTPVRLFGDDEASAKVKNILLVEANVIDWDNSVVGELDVTDHSDFPLALTFQISDFKDLTSTTGDYSKSFKIPATKNNNNIFKHLFIPNLINENKITDKKSCRIIFDGLYSIVGLIQVDGVGGYGETPSYYNCVFFGSNLSWSNKLQDAYMNIIEWGSDGENLIYNKNSITPTWNYIDCNSSTSPIVYPITSYGDYNAEGIEKTIQLLYTAFDATGGSVNKTGFYGFYNNGDNYETPTPVADWRPALFVKPTLDKIFTQLGGGFGIKGYKINSAFMDTDMFKRLVWTLPNFKYNNPDDRTIKYGYGNKFTGAGLIESILVAPTNPQTFPVPFQTTDTVLDLNDSSDFLLNSNRDNTGWDLSTGIITVPEFGNYKVNLNNFGLFAEPTTYIGGSLDVEFVKLRVQLQTVGQTSWNTVDFSQTGSFYLSASTINNPIQTFPSIELTRYFNKDDKLRLNIQIKSRTRAYAGNKLTIHLFGSSTPTSATTSDSSDALYNVDINPFQVEYGQTYNLKEVINSNYKQLDFIKGVAHAFNLQMTTDESTRTVNIEPYDTFYEPYGEAIDWTYKLDRSSVISDKWLEGDLKRTLIFKYKTDSADKRVESRSTLFDDIKDEYPYREILPDTFKKGNSIYENPFFAGSYNAKDQDTVFASPKDTAFSACLWTDNVSPNDLGRPNKGYDFLPRLLYWNSYTSGAAINNTSKTATVQTYSVNTKLIVASSSYPAGDVFPRYPQATMLNRDSTTSPNLAYGNAWVRDYDDITAIYTSYQSGKGLFDTYYRNMIEGFKKSPRLRTLSLSLTVSDIVNLNFKKLIYLDGVYWRLNRIIDFMPNKNTTTKVELIEWFQIGIFAPTVPMFGQSGGSSWNEDASSDDNSNDNMGF